MTLNSNTKYLIALTIAVVLVTGALTLPFAFDDHLADAKKKKKNKIKKIVVRGADGLDGANGGVSHGANGCSNC
jgi:hypothetical protein